MPRAPKFFVVHPVTSGKVTFREFMISRKYLEEKRAVEERNEMRQIEGLWEQLEPLPEIPRFTGDPNKDKIRVISVIRMVEEFLSFNRQSFEFNDDRYADNDVEFINEYRARQDDSDSFESGYLSSDSCESEDSMIEFTEDVEFTLMYSFEDICIDLVNNTECDDVSCTAKHAFPSREIVRRRLASHTEEQIDKAYALILRSKVLKRKYEEVFKDFLPDEE